MFRRTIAAASILVSGLALADTGSSLNVSCISERFYPQPPEALSATSDATSMRLAWSGGDFRDLTDVLRFADPAFRGAVESVSLDLPHICVIASHDELVWRCLVDAGTAIHLAVRDADTNTVSELVVWGDGAFSSSNRAFESISIDGQVNRRETILPSLNLKLLVNGRKVYTAVRGDFHGRGACRVGTPRS